MFHFLKRFFFHKRLSVVQYIYQYWNKLQFNFADRLKCISFIWHIVWPAHFWHIGTISQNLWFESGKSLKSLKIPANSNNFLHSPRTGHFAAFKSGTFCGTFCGYCETAGLHLHKQDVWSHYVLLNGIHNITHLQFIWIYNFIVRQFS